MVEFTPRRIVKEFFLDGTRYGTASEQAVAWAMFLMKRYSTFSLKPRAAAEEFS